MKDIIKIAYTTFVCPNNYIIEFKDAVEKDIMLENGNIRIDGGNGSKDWWIVWNNESWHHYIYGWQK